MKNLISLTFAFVIIISITSFSQTPQKVSCIDAVKYPGKEITVFGKVDEVLITRTNKIFICLGGDYRLADCKAVIEPEDFKKFKSPKSLEGKEVEITGKIVIYNLLPQISITDPEQVKIVEGKE